MEMSRSKATEHPEGRRLAKLEDHSMGKLNIIPLSKIPQHSQEVDLSSHFFNSTEQTGIFILVYLL